MEMFEWYMIRATGTVAYIMLYLSIIVGLYSQVQKKRKRKMTSTLYWHESLANWALILTIGHVGLLLIDSYMSFNWLEVLVPFTSQYQTLSMGLGTIAMYFIIMTIITSQARKMIGYQRWRKLHALNPILYILVTVHGLMSGSDFQGVILAAVNILPFAIFAIVMLKDKLTVSASQYKENSPAGESGRAKTEA
ncbi:ferric reductase-like transmembrane domain-containing protein [Bacillus sp. BRMEA1]|uniref:ferric reductase-like transmembrane domain-containing protein n=1 Tax=Neobacillus endophyticus TaxID=2738405 RepID=UPI001565B57E|nr:ferric reductase-like transmembrane domain-containing protein [Neobacillus endophyticus]NRD76182.1 ferric reductase-like transmembrane domain-containing protein [Neobacillus endophyticus]